MKMLCCLFAISLWAIKLQAQQVNFYSNTMKANVAIDVNTMSTSNSRAFALLLDEGENVVSHQLEGIKATGDSLDAAAEKLKKNTAGAAPANVNLTQLQSGIQNNALQRTDLENKLAVITKAKKAAADLMDQERKNYVNVVQRAKAAAAASRATQFQPTTHHDFYSPAYEQLKHINSTGNW